MISIKKFNKVGSLKFESIWWKFQLIWRKNSINWLRFLRRQKSITSFNRDSKRRIFIFRRKSRRMRRKCWISVRVRFLIKKKLNSYSNFHFIKKKTKENPRKKPSAYKFDDRPDPYNTSNTFCCRKFSFPRNKPPIKKKPPITKTNH